MPLPPMQIVTDANTGITTASVTLAPEPTLLMVRGVVSVSASKSSCLSDTCNDQSAVSCVSYGGRYYALFPRVVPQGSVFSVPYRIMPECIGSDYTPTIFKYYLVGE